jgi:hypothetical protein
MATSVKASQLPVSNTISGTDRIVTLVNPSGVPVLVTIPFSAFKQSISNTVPLHANSAGVSGTFASDSNYLYFCVANANWGRIAISNTSW